MRTLFCLALGASTLAGCSAGSRPAPLAPAAAMSTLPVTRPVARAMAHDGTTDEGDDLRRGVFLHASVAGPGKSFEDLGGVCLSSPEPDFPLVGSWTSPTHHAPHPFTELLPSWNAYVPEGTGIRFDVRTRDAAGGGWSPWLYIGYWGRVIRDARAIAFAGGKVEVDTLVLTRPADAYQVRATLMSFQPDAATSSSSSSSPKLRCVSVVTSRESDVDYVARPLVPLEPMTLDVPFRAQGVESRSISHSICSPTSVTMVLAWAGRDLPTAQNALAIWDDDYAIFGNWNRAVQYAGSLGFDAQLRRFSTMAEARELLKSGQPIIASIRFKSGEFPSNLQDKTAGHLIVLRGYDAHGDILVNDPASRDKGHGIIYKADELAHAWLVNTGGVGYVIKKNGA